MRSRERARSDRGASVLGPAGAVALGGVLLIVASLAFGAVPLLVGGVGFVLLAVIVPSWAVLAARGATVTRQLTGRHIIEDEPLELTVVVRRGPLGLPGAEVFEPIAGARIAVREALSLLSGARQVELRVVTRLHRRGRYVFAPPTLCIADTLSLVALTKPGAGPNDELLVLPRTEPVRWQRSERRTMTPGPSVELRPLSRSAPERSMACGPTSKGPRRRGSIGRRSREEPACSSGGWSRAAHPAAARPRRPPGALAGST